MDREGGPVLRLVRFGRSFTGNGVNRRRGCGRQKHGRAWPMRRESHFRMFTFSAYAGRVEPTEWRLLYRSRIAALC